jgi:multidrug efflux pump subunit AcrA (membrane-fusion protein)
LTIPVSAVLVTGKRNIVYVMADHENHFEAREVRLGARSDGRYEVLDGLVEGEMVVSQGGYLIDSESQLRTGSGASHQHSPSTEAEPTGTPGEKHDH